MTEHEAIQPAAEEHDYSELVKNVNTVIDALQATNLPPLVASHAFVISMAQAFNDIAFKDKNEEETYVVQQRMGSIYNAIASLLEAGTENVAEDITILCGLLLSSIEYVLLKQQEDAQTES